MKKYQYIFAALLAIAACQKNGTEPEVIEEEPVWGYITAEISTTAVKGVLVDGEEENTLDFKWEVGDKIRMAVNKGTLETPNYAWRNGYIYSINEGEHTVTIKYDKGTGANIANYIVGAWYPWLDNENSEPTAIRTTQDYSIGKVSIPLHATNVSTENPIDVGTAAGADAELAQKLVFGPYNPGGTAYSVLGFRLKKGNADRTIKSIKVNNGSQDYTLTNINTALTDDVQYFYIVLPASSTPLYVFKATIVANDGDNDLEYTRTKSSYTPTAGTVTRFPLIADLDDTGKHLWYCGTGQSNISEAPIQYIYKLNGSNTIDSENMEQGDGKVTIKTHINGTKYFGNIALIFNKYYSANGTATSNSRSTKATFISFPYRDNPIPFVAVHAGNYPIFAIKMFNPAGLGTGRNFILDTNTENVDSYFSNFINYKGKVGKAANQQKYLDESKKSSAEDVVMYYDLSSQQFDTGGLAKDTGVIPFTTWQIKVVDIVAASAPEYNIYWAGFFNSVDELTTFASTH